MDNFCAFAHSEIFQTTARKSGVGRGQFDAGVTGLSRRQLTTDLFFSDAKWENVVTSCEILVASAKFFSRIGNQESAISNPVGDYLITISLGSPSSGSATSTKLICVALFRESRRSKE